MSRLKLLPLEWNNERTDVRCYKIHGQKIESFFKRSHKVIIALTVQEILDEHIAKKLV